MIRKISTTFILATLICLLLLSSTVSAQTVEPADSSTNRTSKYDDIIINRGNILTWEDFTIIKAEVDSSKKEMTNEDIKRLIVQTIIQKEKEQKHSTEISLKYTIWGMNLNAAELALVVLYPDYAIWVYVDAQTALTTAQSLYQASTLYQGNGDAFRHAYWNVLMTCHIGSFAANLFATAHESTTPDGIDKTMDLNNNQIGRNIGIYYGTSYTNVVTYVNNGWLYRIVNGYLTVTDSSGRL